MSSKTISVFTNRITKYERTRVIGTRAQQIERGAETFLKLTKKELEQMTAYEIAKREYKEGLIPYTIERKFPNHTEYWNINDFKN